MWQRVGGSGAARQGGGDLKIPKGNCRFLQIGFLQVYLARLAPCKAGAADLGATAHAADPYWLA